MTDKDRIMSGLFLFQTLQEAASVVLSRFFQLFFEEVQGSGQDFSQRPTWGDIPGMYIREKTPRQTWGTLD